nr:LPXTG cell wall anchor domain-containing protein [Vibrio tapetis]
MKIKIITLTALLASGSAAAEDSAITTALKAAIATGQENYGYVVVGLIALAALGFGLRSITGGMKSA